MNGISVKELTEQIAILMKDEIVAIYTQNENSILMKFSNGQKFVVSVAENK